MDTAKWDRLARGIDCPFDAPRKESTDEWQMVVALSASTLYLSNNQTYRGHCLLILDLKHATRPDQLSADEWAAFSSDLHRASSAITQTVKPDHINVAALGNLVPHLHWHIVPRYRSDPRWGGPIWSADMPDTRLTAAEQRELIKDLRAALGA
jgi:diadenosine tetraphosphate (Ap4A) HIT family hydrolase